MKSGLETSVIHHQSSAEIKIQNLTLTNFQNIIFAVIDNTKRLEVVSCLVQGNEIVVPTDDSEDRTPSSSYEYLVFFLKIRDVGSVQITSLTVNNTRFIRKAIEITSSTNPIEVAITNCTFRSNTVATDWDASNFVTLIFIQNSVGGKILIENSSFVGNRIYYSWIDYFLAPTLSMVGDSMDCQITGSNFTDNFVKMNPIQTEKEMSDARNGFNIDSLISHNILGSVYYLDIYNSNFARNGKKLEFPIGQGAALKTPAFSTIVNCSFEENVAYDGTIFLLPELGGSLAIIDQKNTVFSNNIQQTSGVFSFSCEWCKLFFKCDMCNFTTNNDLERYFPQGEKSEYTRRFISVFTEKIVVRLKSSSFSSYPFYFTEKDEETEKMRVKQNEENFISIVGVYLYSDTFFSDINIEMKENDSFEKVLKKEKVNVEEPEEFFEEYEHQQLKLSHSPIEISCDFRWFKLSMNKVRIASVTSLDEFIFRRYDSFFKMKNIQVKAKNIEISNTRINGPLFALENTEAKFKNVALEKVLTTSVFFVDDQTNLTLKQGEFTSTTSYDGVFLVNPVQSIKIDEGDNIPHLRILNATFQKNYGKFGSAISIYSLYNTNIPFLLMKNVTIRDSYSFIGGGIFARGDFDSWLQDVIIQNTKAFSGPAVAVSGVTLNNKDKWEITESFRELEFRQKTNKSHLWESYSDMMGSSSDFSTPLEVIASQSIINPLAIPITGCQTPKVAMFFESFYGFLKSESLSKIYEILPNQAVYEIKFEDIDQVSSFDLMEMFENGLSSVEEQFQMVKNKNAFELKNYTIVFLKNISQSVEDLKNSQDLDSLLKIETYLGTNFLQNSKIAFLDCNNQALLSSYFFTNNTKLSAMLSNIHMNFTFGQVSLGANIQNETELDFDVLKPIFEGWLEDDMQFDPAILQFTLDSGTSFKSNFFLEIHPGSCSSGYLLDHRTFLFPNCIPCPFSQYSIEGVDDPRRCYDCPAQGICEDGQLYIREKYWRSSKDTSLVLECPKNNSCISEFKIFSDTGGYQEDFQPGVFISRSCSNGYIGATCSECDTQGKTTRNGTKYFDKGQCIAVKSTSEEKKTEGLWLAWNFFFLVANIFINTFIQNFMMIQMVKLNESSIVGEGYLNHFKTSPSPILKIFMIYLTMIRFIFFLLEDKLPSMLRMFVFSSSNSFDGIKQHLDYFMVSQIVYTSIWNYYVLLWVIVISVLFTLILSTLYYFVHFKITKDKFWGSYIFTTLLVFYISASPDVVYICTRNVLNIVINEDPDNEIPSKVSFYTSSLSSEDPSIFMVKVASLAGLLIFVVIIPLFFVVRIRIALKKRELNKKSFFIKYSYYYKEFKEEYYFFEILRVYTKMLFSFLAVLPGIEVSVKLMLLMAMFAIYYILVLKVKPYKNQTLNYFDRISGMVFLTTLFGGLTIMEIFDLVHDGIFVSMDAPWESIFYEWIFSLASIIVLVANGFYIFSILKLLYVFIREKVKENKKRMENMVEKAMRLTFRFTHSATKKKKTIEGIESPEDNYKDLPSAHSEKSDEQGGSKDSLEEPSDLEIGERKDGGSLNAEEERKEESESESKRETEMHERIFNLEEEAENKGKKGREAICEDKSEMKKPTEFQSVVIEMEVFDKND